jgi:prepilin-type N-terminal cleavage/methylation domain-containing protein
MELSFQSQRRAPRSAGGFTLIEVLVSAAVLLILIIGLYGGISSGLAVLQASRERLAATHICTEKMELIRMYTWDQVKTSGYVPTTFIEKMYPTSLTNRTSVNGTVPPGQGTTFYGSISITTPNTIPAAYSNSLRFVTVTVNWTNGAIARSHAMSTYISQHGIHDFIF